MSGAARAGRADAAAADLGQPPRLHVDGAIATITLRRPAVANRLEMSDLELLLAQVRQVDADPQVRVLRLVGEGRHFCSGFNLGEVGAPDAGARFEALGDAIEQARPITLARIHGGVFGGGTDLALACDFRLGGPRAEMAVPAARIGLHFYRGGLERYVARLGLATAKRLLLTAERLDAQAMRDCGYLDRLLPSPEALDAELESLSASLAGMAPLATLGMKRHLDRIARGTLDAEALARDIARADASADLREGARAIREKRAPVFHGR